MNITFKLGPPDSDAPSLAIDEMGRLYWKEQLLSDDTKLSFKMKSQPTKNSKEWAPPSDTILSFVETRFYKGRRWSREQNANLRRMLLKKWLLENLNPKAWKLCNRLAELETKRYNELCDPENRAAVEEKLTRFGASYYALMVNNRERAYEGLAAEILRLPAHWTKGVWKTKYLRAIGMNLPATGLKPSQIRDFVSWLDTVYPIYKGLTSDDEDDFDVFSDDANDIKSIKVNDSSLTKLGVRACAQLGGVKRFNWDTWKNAASLPLFKWAVRKNLLKKTIPNPLPRKIKLSDFRLGPHNGPPGTRLALANNYLGGNQYTTIWRSVRIDILRKYVQADHLQIAFGELQYAYTSLTAGQVMSPKEIRKALATSQRQLIDTELVMSDFFGIPRNWVRFISSRMKLDWMIAKKDYLLKERPIWMAGVLHGHMQMASRLDEVLDEDLINGPRTDPQKVFERAQERMVNRALSAPDFPLAVPIVEVPLEGIRFIGTAHELIMEGKLMRHCVGGYTQYAKRGEYFHWHLGEEAPNGATIQLDANGRFVQSYGYLDMVLSEEMYVTIKEWAEAMMVAIAKAREEGGTVTVTERLYDPVAHLHLDEPIPRRGVLNIEVGMAGDF